MRAIVRRVRNPEYTGENRCTACTVVNSVVVVALVAGVGWLGLVTAGSAVALALSVATGAVATGSIYFRGYLVPKTPELTKRYLPPWVLHRFGKAPVTFDDDVEDAEDVLFALEVLREVDGTTELAPEFADSWLERVDDTPRDDAVPALVAGLSVPDEVTVTTDADGDWIEVTVGDLASRKWESETAVLADAASAAVLQGGPWEELSVTDKLQCLRRVRAYLDECPCGGRPEIEPGEAVVCCSDEIRPVLTCTDCGARLHEFGDLD